MHGDRQPFSPTQLAQLERCESQVLFDRRFGARRSSAWQKRSAEGRAVHTRLHREVTAPSSGGTKRMLIVAIIAALVASLFIIFALRGGSASSDALLPPELQGAELWASEKTLVRQKPVHIRGRPDEVWLKDGRRTIVETKSREGRVFAGDRMQLAAYAYLLRGDDGPPVAPYAYVRFTGGALSFSKVRLQPEKAVIAAHRRLSALKAGKTKPGFAGQAAVCRGCGHRERCAFPKAA
ncbi:MAG: PD-(D/E)XK nuclease family protein [Pseudomonadota bacterium]